MRYYKVVPSWAIPPYYGGEKMRQNSHNQQFNESTNKAMPRVIPSPLLLMFPSTILNLHYSTFIIIHCWQQIDVRLFTVNELAKFIGWQHSALGIQWSTKIINGNQLKMSERGLSTFPFLTSPLAFTNRPS